MIRAAIEQYVMARPARRDTPVLYVSDMGYHPYKAMARILRGETAEFDADTRIKMQYGNAFEAETERALQFAHANVLTQFPLWDDKWSGYADFVIGHGEDGRQPMIIEHKATGDKWFDYKNSLPRAAHICQLWMYGWLYEQMYGVHPYLVLYYVAWGSFAEFAIRPGGAGVIAEGSLNGRNEARERRIAPNLLRLELERFFKTKTLPQPDGADNWEYAEEAHTRLLADLLKNPAWKGVTLC